MHHSEKLQYLEFAKGIAHKAGDIMLHYFDMDHQTELKGDGTPVTIADTEINRMVIEQITAKYPGQIVIGEEESTGGYGMGLRWVCDPIDGTLSFMWGIPVATFALALLEDGRPVVAVIHNPFTRELFTATVGGGAFLNDKKIQVNSSAFEDSLITSDGVPKYSWQPADNFAAFVDGQGASMIRPYVGGIHKYSQIARGRLAGYINLGTSAHDVAAGNLIVAEAGGTVTDIDGNIIMYLQQKVDAIGSNGVIHDQLRGIVKTRRDG